LLKKSNDILRKGTQWAECLWGFIWRAEDLPSTFRWR